MDMLNCKTGVFLFAHGYKSLQLNFIQINVPSMHSQAIFLDLTYLYH